MNTIKTSKEAILNRVWRNAKADINVGALHEIIIKDNTPFITFTDPFGNLHEKVKAKRPRIKARLVYQCDLNKVNSKYESKYELTK